jgi:hypothetical protein
LSIFWEATTTFGHCSTKIKLNIKSVKTERERKIHANEKTNTKERNSNPSENSEKETFGRHPNDLISQRIAFGK